MLFVAVPVLVVIVITKPKSVWASSFSSRSRQTNKFPLHPAFKHFSICYFSILFICLFYPLRLCFHLFFVANVNLWLFWHSSQTETANKEFVCAYREIQIKLLDMWPRKKQKQRRSEVEKHNCHCKLLLAQKYMVCVLWKVEQWKSQTVMSST